MKQVLISLAIAACCAALCVLAAVVGDMSGVALSVAGVALMSVFGGIDLGVAAHKKGWLQ